MEIKVRKEIITGFETQIIKLISEQIFRRSQDNLIEPRFGEHIITDTGALKNSGVVTHYPGKSVISYLADYATEVEFGQPAGTKVSPKELRGWVRRKLGITRKKDMMSAAYAISKSIYEHGTPPKPYIREAIDYVSASKRVE